MLEVPGTLEFPTALSRKIWGLQVQPDQVFWGLKGELLRWDFSSPGARYFGLDNKKRPRSEPKPLLSCFRRKPTRSLQRPDVFCLPALGAFGDFELYGLAFLQAAEAPRLNGGEMDKNIVASLPADKAITASLKSRTAPSHS